MSRDLQMGAFSVMVLALREEARHYVMTSRPPTYQIRRRSDEAVVFESWTLWERMGRAVELHRMLNPDDPDCFHTHPAEQSMRMVVEGGYVEEVYSHGGKGSLHAVSVGHFGEVSHGFAHRIHALPHGISVSLWWRGVREHEIKLLGRGWGDE